MKSAVVDSSSLLLVFKFDEEFNGWKALFKSVNGWRKLLFKSLPDVNGSNALKRRLVDDTDDDEDADDDDNGEKCGWMIDWDCCCCCCCVDWDEGKSGNLLFISDENCNCGSINSVIQFEQSRDEEDDVIIIGISLRHDEQTPPVVLLLILLVSFILLNFSLALYRGLSSKQAVICIKPNESCC